jgi:hypothetical protein
MRRFTVKQEIAILGLIVLVMLGLSEFMNRVEASQVQPLTEIEVRNRKPTTMRQMLIDQCPHERGNLRLFIDCYSRANELTGGSDVRKDI